MANSWEEKLHLNKSVVQIKINSVTKCTNAVWKHYGSGEGREHQLLREGRKISLYHLEGKDSR